ncbi:GNAT family N-acetyltransferase [Nocardioides sp. cx-173]|uniref:GNAT family N-acetyltransferase n=1 Tax=Nocardioides sp. cx-173 TaxID=2898796 RepID=UPI001E3823BD|nr:GNAT family N-acetyltransferase [Nocardioides sp. cx-173]MCD4525418.1 GNAT family N-acetyltransferase [Nocardioides sp. cx-173]UGB40787.1 GNAT family N-acetyltransferase [Nocardioides sp. cx-173]
MTDPLLAVYDDQLRGSAEVVGARSWERSGPLWMGAFGDHGLVSYRSLAGLDRAAVAGLVRVSLDHFAADPEVATVEWKTRGHDRPAELPGWLESLGFVAEEVETVMLGEAAHLADAPAPPDGVVVRRVDALPDRAALLDAAADLQAAVFGYGGDGAELLARVERSEGNTEVWVAEADGVVVSAGRLEVVPGTECAGLWGGVTLPQWRGRGIYRALTAARAESALQHGVRHLHSDCTAMSRPILERSGLRAVTTTTPYVWRG